MRDGLRDMRVVAVIFIQLVVIVGRSASPPVPGPLLPVKVVGLRGVREGAEPGSILSEGQGVPLASDVRTWYAAIPSNGGSWYADIEANKVRPRRRRSRNVVDTDREPSRAFRRRWSGGPWGVFKCLGNSSRTGGDCPGNVTYGIAELSGESWKMLLCERCSVGMPDAVYLRRRCMVCPREASFGNPGARIRDARHCTWHRGDMEVDLRHVRCRHAEGCERRAQFGVKAGGRTMPQFCGAHRLPHHHDATHRACAAPGCRSRALFGNATIGMRFCAVHKEKLHTNLSRRPELSSDTLQRPRRAGSPRLRSVATVSSG